MTDKNQQKNTKFSLYIPPELLSKVEKEANKIGKNFTSKYIVQVLRDSFLKQNRAEIDPKSSESVAENSRKILVEAERIEQKIAAFNKNITDLQAEISSQTMSKKDVIDTVMRVAQLPTEAEKACNKYISVITLHEEAFHTSATNLTNSINTIANYNSQLSTAIGNLDSISEKTEALPGHIEVLKNSIYSSGKHIVGAIIIGGVLSVFTTCTVISRQTSHLNPEKIAAICSASQKAPFKKHAPRRGK